MDLGQFLLRLQGSGQVLVSRDVPVARGDAEQVLRDTDAAVRLDAPDGLPPFDGAAALWAAERLYDACALFAHRDLGPDVVHERLGVACPSSARLPATHFAVDLAFRHLPELVRIARGVAPDDPLLVALRGLARAWPLSSVGLADVGPVDVEVLCANDGLRRFYVDRILCRGDADRARDPSILSAIDAALGTHREFAKSLLGGGETRLTAEENE
jgi:hypothetical protein